MGADRRGAAGLGARFLEPCGEELRPSPGLGVNISEPQLEACRARCQGLPVDFLLQELSPCSTAAGFAERFGTPSVAIAMINHIGPKNYPQFFANHAWRY